MLFIALVKFQFGSPATLHTMGLDKFFYKRRNVNIFLSISPHICFGAQMNCLL